AFWKSCRMDTDSSVHPITNEVWLTIQGRSSGMGTGRESVVTLEPEENKKSKVDFLFNNVLDGMDELEKMFQNMEFFKGETDEEYTVEGSIISCNYGYDLTRIGIVKDHAVYDNNGNAVLTCGDCVEKENVYNFGLCGSPILDKNSEETIIERGVPFATGQKIRGYKCKLQLAPGWQTGNVHTHIWNADKNKYEAVLPKDGVLTCMYGAGTIKSGIHVHGR
ncbi:PAAR-like protein, partial [Bacteroides acidifaciens]|uniref:PAAR-like protein n=1 Tax=Bacteroides acidifaciens TaxID=85831 RepID=UPI0025A58C02